jgi:small-conductance mechanosensitive channel
MNLSVIEEQLKNWHLRKFGRVDLDVAAWEDDSHRDW